MADMNFDRLKGNGRASGDGEDVRVQNLINLSGAAISVVLVIGLAVWGYRLAVRDVSGIPVIQAIEGPLRIAPENPGGTVADNQGLAVNAIAADGIAAAPAERLVLAPRPVELALDDAPGLSSVTSPPPEDQLDDILVDAATTPAAAAASDAVDQSAIDLALAAALQDGGETSAVQEAPAEAATGTNVSGSLLRSPRPLPRPNSVAANSNAVAPDAVAPDVVAVDVATIDTGTVQEVISVASPEMQPEDVQVGTRLVQLGAFDSADGARAEWTRLQGRFGDLMAGKAIIVQPAESGGQTFFRLRAFGFSDEDDSRRFCSALLSEETPCIPVSHR